MGDAADDMADLLISQFEEEEQWYLNCMQRGVWVTVNNDRIPIASMETGHIRNCIALIERVGKKSVRGLGLKYLPLLKTELSKR